MIRVESLSFAYDTATSFKFKNFECLKGDNLLLLGKSGSGKTSLLHLMAGILKAGSGSVFINGTDITKLKGAEMDRFRGRNIGMIFQHNYFIGSVSVLGNLQAAQYLAGFESDRNFAFSLIESLGLSGLEHKKPVKLSMGEKQRFSIARALINKPLLLLADEPTSSLDDENCDNFMALIAQQTEALGTTLIVASHDIRLKPHFNQIYNL